MIAYLAGTSANNQKAKIPTIWACDFNSGLAVRAKTFIGEEVDQNPFVVKRFPSYEILAIGCMKNMYIMEYNQTNQTFSPLAKLPNLHSDIIADICIKNEKIYSKGLKESFVRVTEFGPRIRNDLLMNPAFTSALQSQLQSPIATTSQLPSSLPDERVRYRQSQISKITSNAPQSLEKITLSKTARVIYAGGGAGIVMFKYNEQFQQYQRMPNPVGLSDSEPGEYQMLWNKEYAKWLSARARSFFKLFDCPFIDR